MLLWIIFINLLINGIIKNEEAYMQEPIVLDHIKIPNARDLGGYLGADGRKILKNVYCEQER